MVPDIAKKGHSFKGAFQYYLHDKGADTAERVGWTETRNVMTDDPMAARNIMIATALSSDELKKAAGVKSTGRKSNQHVYAYSLAWHDSEADGLDKAEMIAAADASLKELGADHLQAVIVCHTDQKHPHVHVVLNRVNPDDGIMHPFKNDRLKLRKWAHEYDRSRGNEDLCPNRKKKMELQEQHQDKKSRQDYAKSKRDEAAARSKDDLSPAELLKDLGNAQKDQHRQEWRDLSAANKTRRNEIYAQYRQRIKDAAALHKIETKPFWRSHFQDERARKKAFDGREESVFGIIENAIDATAYQHMKGELNGRGQLSATFSNVLSSQRRRAAFEGRLEMDKSALRRELKQILDDDIGKIKSERSLALAKQRSDFDANREKLITRQDAEREKIREAWRQLYASRGMVSKFGRPSAEGSEPVKKDFDNSRRKDTPKPKTQPTRTAHVSSPSPAPQPRGEAPRVTSKPVKVPTKDWSKSGTQRPAKGISGTEPAKKDWSKSAAPKSASTPPKDWSKKAERSAVKKAPTPRRDMDRSR